MLDIAMKYTDKLKIKFADTIFDDKYNYYYNTSYRNEYKPETSTWDKHEFVSINNDDIIGYMAYSINRDTNAVVSLNIINFTKPNMIFSKDLKKFLTDIFEKFNFRKLTFGVTIGNPIEASYDKLIKKYGGRIVGVYEKEDKLIDGTYTDSKMYEIFRENYLKSKGGKYD
jgi:hypothetical protein